MAIDQPTQNGRSTSEKYADLLEILRNCGKTAVAFSGGVDSTFLLAAAGEAPTEKLVALTMKQPYFQQRELEEAAAFVKDFGVEHRVIEAPVDPRIMENPPNRCYLCKTATFKKFRKELDYMGFDTLLDGTNADDTHEYRPGLQAIEEQRVRSPLMEAGLTKNDIRLLSREMGLPIWDKPSNTCLVTRIPYNTKVLNEDLRQIEEAEFYLKEKGFLVVRVRKHGDLARIEVEPELIARLAKPEIMNATVAYFKKLGFRHVSLDLEGYMTGSMDKAILETSQTGAAR
ncbi:ATP-dependent sacrificial sulfur transferase LarE [Balneolales bacterium ANBcel1]|nr:ATP-dependent sacrificial sulfur transferase LarE [Balneolales bacterium ANBcel1]